MNFLIFHIGAMLLPQVRDLLRFLSFGASVAPSSVEGFRLRHSFCELVRGSGLGFSSGGSGLQDIWALLRAGGFVTDLGSLYELLGWSGRAASVKIVGFRGLFSKWLVVVLQGGNEAVPIGIQKQVSGAAPTIPSNNQNAPTRKGNFVSIRINDAAYKN
ncbi:hypothetical protein FNV43_RR27077 [Rhamnella rubrinervis]|uniref:Uncharacterized protein n=1 Tax=Rhamnella rubrinervis TaxID=2594499 RepID=A0A8K0DW67_9ROSA|nr:hypothetical protein FNV43_RR27077 [Rhamnella rubrinervis]